MRAAAKDSPNVIPTPSMPPVSATSRSIRASSPAIISHNARLSCPQNDVLPNTASLGPDGIETTTLVVSSSIRSVTLIGLLTSQTDEKVQPRWSAWMADCCRLQRLVVSHNCHLGLQQRIVTGSHHLRAAAERRHQQTCDAAKAACTVYHERDPLSNFARNHTAAHVSKQQVFDRRSAVGYYRSFAVQHGPAKADVSFSIRSCKEAPVAGRCYTAP